MPNEATLPSARVRWLQHTHDALNRTRGSDSHQLVAQHAQLIFRQPGVAHIRNGPRGRFAPRFFSRLCLIGRLALGAVSTDALRLADAGRLLLERT
eukprot:scaffold4340_cov123-Isochrysis_galbana.AAC.3